MLLFCEESGLLRFLKERNIKDLGDYLSGTEVGLDSNARKNRSGAVMEALVRGFIDGICKKHNFEYLVQASAVDIKDKFDVSVNEDETKRRFDFAVFNGRVLFLIETNYYSSKGTKLKAVAVEFSKLHDLVKDQRQQPYLDHRWPWLAQQQKLV